MSDSNLTLCNGSGMNFNQLVTNQGTVNFMLLSSCPLREKLQNCPSTYVHGVNQNDQDHTAVNNTFVVVNIPYRICKARI